METAEGEQRLLFLWIKTAVQYPGLEQFMREMKRVEDPQGAVSLELLHRAVGFPKSFNKYQIRSLSITDEYKEDMVRLEKIRLKEIEIRVAGIVGYIGWLKK